MKGIGSPALSWSLADNLMALEGYIEAAIRGGDAKDLQQADGAAAFGCGQV
jgi:hypothetical protein